MTNFQRRLLTDIPLMDEGVLLSLLMSEPGEQAAEHPYLKELRVKLKPQMSVSADGIADIPVEGALAYRPDAFEMAFLGVEDSRNVPAVECSISKTYWSNFVGRVLSRRWYVTLS